MVCYLVEHPKHQQPHDYPYVEEADYLGWNIPYNTASNKMTCFPAAEEQETEGDGTREDLVGALTEVFTREGLGEAQRYDKHWVK